MFISSGHAQEAEEQPQVTSFHSDTEFAPEIGLQVIVSALNSSMGS